MHIKARKVAGIAWALMLGWGGFTDAPAGTIGVPTDWSRWEEVEGLPAQRSSMGAAVLNGKLYAIGGYLNGVGGRPNVYCFDGTHWVETNGLAVSLFSMGAATLDNKLYAIGGMSGSAQSNVYCFDGSAWTEVNSLPERRMQLAAATLNDKIYALGGYIPSVSYSNVYCFDGASWTETNYLPARIQRQAAGVLNGKIYSVAGAIDSDVVSNVYCFDGTSWAETNGLPAKRSDLAGGVLAGRLYVFGGMDFVGLITNSVYVFDGTGWTNAAGLPKSLRAPGGAVFNGQLYAIGGETNGYICQTNVYRYPVLSTNSGVSPASGSWTGGYQVTISGTNLFTDLDVDSTTGVVVCGRCATVSAFYPSSGSGTQLVVNIAAIPRGQLRHGDVVIYSAAQGVTVGSNKFTYTADGPLAGGNTLLVTNGNYGTITNVLVGGAAATLQDSGATWARITVPAGAAAGAADVVVQTSDNGAITIAGGYRYNPSGQIGGTNINWSQWQEVAGLPAARWNLAAGTLNGAIYAVGGRNNVGVAQTNVYRFDGTAWMEKSGLPTQRAYHAVGVVSNALYVLCGRGTDGLNTTNVFRFDGTNWTEVQGQAWTWAEMAAGTLDGKLYSIAGIGGGSYRTNVLEYDGAVWSQVEGLPEQRCSLAAGTLNDKLYAVGGYYGNAHTNVYQYDGAHWTEVAGLPIARAYMAAGVLNGALYTIGGYGPSTYRTNVFRFDGASWTEVAGLPQGKQYLAAATLNGALYAIGGYDGLAHSNVYRYPAWNPYPGVAPSNGALAGGYPVIISGTNLCDGTTGDVTAVTLCGVTAAVQSVAGTTQIVVTAGAALGPATGTVAVVSLSHGTTVKSNAFTYTGAPVLSGWLAVSVTPEAGSWSLTTPAGYTGPTAGTGSLAAVAAATGQYAIAWGALPGYTAPAAQTQQVITASTTLFTGVYTELPGSGWLAVSVTPGAGSWELTAPAGYSGPTSGTGSLAAVSAPTGLYLVIWGALAGYVEPWAQSLLITGGSTGVFAGVYLPVSTNLGAPREVTATEGIYTNFIRVAWQGVEGALGYDIWRSETNAPATAERIAQILPPDLRRGVRSQRSGVGLPCEALAKQGGRQGAEIGKPGKRSTFNVQPQATSGQRTTDNRQPGQRRTTNAEPGTSFYYYDDFNIVPVQAYYYWVRAKTSTLISPLSYVGMGYAALPPEEAAGAADLAAEDLVFLPVNMTNQSPAGTVSCRVLNNGPDALQAAAIGFDFHMVSNATSIWIGSAQSNLTLNPGQEALVILTPQARRGLAARADLAGIQQVTVTIRHLGALHDPNLANNTTAAPGAVLVRTAGVNSPGRSLSDYDGDGKSDVALCRADKGVWVAVLSGTRGRGTTGIAPELGGGRFWTAAGDYDGDGLLDYGLYEEISGYWWILKSSDGQVLAGPLGGPEQRPVAADYDGDRKSDPAVYGPAWGYWEILKSGSGYAPVVAWTGGLDYEPVVADYDGDGLADPMACLEANGHWVGLLSGQSYAPVEGWFGGPGCRAGAMDFDGDGLADPVVYRAADGLWQVRLSTGSGALTTFLLGGPEYVATPGDYDGDGRADPGVYTEQGGAWYGWLSGHDWQWSSARFGGPGFQPVGE